MKTTNVKEYKNRRRSEKHFHAFLTRILIAAALVVIANFASVPFMCALLGASLVFIVTGCWRLHLSFEFARIADREALR